MRPHTWEKILGIKPPCFGDYTEKHRCGTFTGNDCCFIDACVFERLRRKNFPFKETP